MRSFHMDSGKGIDSGRAAPCSAGRVRPKERSAAEVARLLREC